MNVNHIYRGENPGGGLQTAEYPVEAPRQMICLCLSVNEDVLVIFTQTHVGGPVRNGVACFWQEQA